MNPIEKRHARCEKYGWCFECVYGDGKDGLRRCTKCGKRSALGTKIWAGWLTGAERRLKGL